MAAPSIGSFPDRNTETLTPDRMRTILPLVLTLSACNGFLDTGKPPTGVPSLFLVGTFSNPVYVTTAPGDSTRLFVVEPASCRDAAHDAGSAVPRHPYRGVVRW